MTADDFFLLFAAFGGFVIAPALLLWGFASLTHRKQDGTRGPDARPNVGSTDDSIDDRSRVGAPSEKADDFLRRIGSWAGAAARGLERPDAAASARAWAR